jgi:hypothetical protein
MGTSVLLVVKSSAPLELVALPDISYSSRLGFALDPYSQGGVECITPVIEKFPEFLIAEQGEGCVALSALPFAHGW